MVDSSIVALAIVLVIIFVIALGWLTLVSRNKGGVVQARSPGLNRCP
jgi:hypothetical protein